ncbi:MAG: tRNA pseudouridine(38-40) synthase TruA [Actinomycetota bacterium]|nr:tRNA pseudouridine(38-40) synthase TruA [Actinomycetota bacterium]
MTLFERDEGPARVRLVVAYDGTGFRGWADQPDVRTVHGVLGRALERFLRHQPENLTGAGRTDAGVHAWGQVVTFDADPGVDPWRLQAALNGQLAPEVVVREAEIVEPGFDARRSACWRAYRYTILNRPVADPFLARYAWWVPNPLDVDALRLGADPFVGEHDFAAFCRQGPEGTTTRRRVVESRWHELGDGVLRYDVQATAFCWQMVRSIVGTLVDVGMGKKRPGDLMAILRAKDRANAGRLAPPEGLCLWQVGYESTTDRR